MVLSESGWIPVMSIHSGINKNLLCSQHVSGIFLGPGDTDVNKTNETFDLLRLIPRRAQHRDVSMLSPSHHLCADLCNSPLHSAAFWVVAFVSCHKVRTELGKGGALVEQIQGDDAVASPSLWQGSWVGKIGVRLQHQAQCWPKEINHTWKIQGEFNLSSGAVKVGRGWERGGICGFLSVPQPEGMREGSSACVLEKRRFCKWKQIHRCSRQITRPCHLAVEEICARFQMNSQNYTKSHSEVLDLKGWSNGI